MFEREGYMSGWEDSHMRQLARDNESIVADKGLPRRADSALAVGGEGNIGS